MTETIHLCFWIPGSVAPKARPRVTRRGTYFPRRYQDWRQLAETEIRILLSGSERVSQPIPRAEVQIKLQGKHRGDLDNLAGACLDSLVASGVLVDDRLGCVPRLVVEHEPKGECGVLVEIIPLKR